MAFFLVLTVLLSLAVLAPVYGADSRRLDESRPGSTWPGLPDSPVPTIAGPLSLGSERATVPSVPRPRISPRAKGLRPERDLVS